MNNHDTSATINEANSTVAISNSSSRNSENKNNKKSPIEAVTIAAADDNNSGLQQKNAETVTIATQLNQPMQNMQKSQVQQLQQLRDANQQQPYQMIFPQMAMVMSSSKADTKSGLRSPISSPLALRKNRGLPPVSPKSTPPLLRKHYPLAYNATTNTMGNNTSTHITIPAVPTRMMAAAIASSPASSLSLSSSTSSPSSSPPPPPIPSRAPKLSSSGNIHRLLNEVPTAKTHKSQISSPHKTAQQKQENPTHINEIDLSKLLAQQKKLEEKTAAVQASSKLDASFYDAEIEMMNKYLKSLPDYSELDRKLHQEFQECEDLYDKLKKRQAPLSKSNSQQSVMGSNKPVIQTQEVKETNTGLTKSSSVNFQIPSNQTPPTRIQYPSIFQQKPKLQRSISSSNMPYNSSSLQHQQLQSSSVLQRNLYYDNHQPLIEEKNSSLNGSNLSLNKQMLNDFWTENLAQSQKRQTPKRTLWNYEKICNPTVGAAGAPLKVDAQTAKKLAIFDPTVAEAAQKELHKQPNKLQKNASLSHLDMKVRQAVTKEDLYKLICNEPSSPKTMETTNCSNLVSKVPLKVAADPATTINKSVSMTHVPQTVGQPPFNNTSANAPLMSNLRRSTSKTHIPCYMKHLPSLSRSTSNSAILLPPDPKSSKEANHVINRSSLKPISQQPLINNTMAMSASCYETTTTSSSSPKTNETSTINPLRGLLKSLSSSNVYGAPKYSPFNANKQQQPQPHMINQLANHPNESSQPAKQPPVEMITSLVANVATTFNANDMKGTTALNDEIMMLKQQKQQQQQQQEQKHKQNLRESLNVNVATNNSVANLNLDSPSLERKSEKSNSTISTSSVTVTNCCTTHLPQLTKFTSSFHIPATQDKAHAATAHSSQGISCLNGGDGQKENPPNVGQYKISKIQSAANLELSKRQKDADNKIEKCFNDIMKKSQHKPSTKITTTSATTSALATTTASISNTTSSASTAISSSTIANACNAEKVNVKPEPISNVSTTSTSNLPNKAGSTNQKVSENLTSQPLTSTTTSGKNLSQIPVATSNLTQTPAKKIYPIGKSNSTSQIPMASFQKPQAMQTIQQQHVAESGRTTSNIQPNYPQQKKTFLNWTSFACNTNDPNYQQHKLQQSGSVNNVARKMQHFQPIQQYTNVSTFKPDFLQKNTNKENKIQMQQQQMFNNQQQCLMGQQQQQQQQPSAFAYKPRTKNPLTHSASFSVVQKPIALQMHSGQQPVKEQQNKQSQYMVNSFSNMIQPPHARQPQHERKVLQTFDPFYANKTMEQKFYQSKPNQQNAQANAAAAAGGVGFNRYQQQFMPVLQKQQQQTQHNPLMQSASASALHFYQSQPQQQMNNSTQVFHQHLMYQQQQQQQTSQTQHPLQQSNSMILNHTKTTNQMSQSALGLHYVEVDS